MRVFVKILAFSWWHLWLAAETFSSWFFTSKWVKHIIVEQRLVLIIVCTDVEMQVLIIPYRQRGEKVETQTHKKHNSKLILFKLH